MQCQITWYTLHLFFVTLAWLVLPAVAHVGDRQHSLELQDRPYAQAPTGSNVVQSPANRKEKRAVLGPEPPVGLTVPFLASLPFYFSTINLPSSLPFHRSPKRMPFTLTASPTQYLASRLTYCHICDTWVEGAGQDLCHFHLYSD